MEKNVAGKWTVFAYGLPDHATPGKPVTGAAASITANIWVDGVQQAVDDTNPTELEDGYYEFDVVEAETNGAQLTLCPESATAEVQVIAVPGSIHTDPPNYADMGIESDGDLTKVNLCANTTLVDTVTTNTDLVTAAAVKTAIEAGGSSLAQILADTNELQTDDIPGTLATIAAYLDTEIAAILADTGELQTDWANGGRLDLLLDACSTHSAADVWAVGTRVLTAGTNLNDLSAADVNAQVDAAIETYKLDHLVAVADADDVADDSIIAKLAATGGDWSTFVGSDDSLQSIKDYGVANWAGSPPTIMASTTITGLVSQTEFNLSAGSADDDAYNDAFALVVDQTTGVQQCICDITDYAGATKTITLGSDPGIFTMANNDLIYIIAAAPGTAAPTAAAIRTEIDTNSTQLADIVADTNELQTDWANGGRLDLLIDACSTHDAAAVKTAIEAGGSSLAQILADTGELQTDWVNGGRLDLLLDACSTHDAAAVKTAIEAGGSSIAQILADTNELQADDTPGALAAIDTKIDTIDDFLDTEIAAILLDTGTTLPATLATIAGYLDTEIAAIVAKLPTNYIMGSSDQADHDGDFITAAEVNAEVVDVLRTDTLAELSQAKPSATPTFATAVMLLYMALRNKSTTTSSEYGVYADDATKIAKAVLDDDGTTFTRAEMASGA